MSSAEDHRQAMIDQYRAQARDAVKLAETWKGTSLEKGWRGIAKSYNDLADEWKNRQHDSWDRPGAANQNGPDH
jgi:hypothetical protein